MNKYLIAHDVGTSGNKSTLFSTDGKLVKSVLKPYNTYYSNDTWAEQDPRDLFEAVCLCTKELIQDIDVAKIAAVCFTGQMQGSICINKKGDVLRNSIIYCDQRGEKQANEVIEKIGMQKGYDITGHRISAVYTGPKLMWIRKNQPEIFSEIYKVLHAKDYLAFMFTGEIATDYSDASGTNLFNQNTYEWDETMFEAMELDQNIMPKVYNSIEVIGEVTRKASEQSGIPKGVPVVIGAGDGIAAAVGANCINAGDTYTCLGTSGWIGCTTQKPFSDKQMRVVTWCHAFKGIYHVIGAMQAAGTSYKWVKEEIYDNSEIGEVANYEMVNNLAQKAQVGAGGVIFLPYLMGERAPHWSSHFRGCYVGLNLTTKKADMLRASLEGVVYNLGIILNAIREEVDISKMLLMGGGAKGNMWRQIVADVYNMEINYPSNLDEATSMGAAILGGIGVGIYKNFEEANVFNEIKGTVYPNKENVKIYEEKLNIFKEIYESLTPVFNKYY